MPSSKSITRISKRALAVNSEEDVVNIIAEHRPELAEDIRRLRSLKNAQTEGDREQIDKFADDLTWLWDFEYEGTKLTDLEINCVLLYIRNGFYNANIALQAYKQNSNAAKVEDVFGRPQVLAALHKATEGAVRQYQISTHKIIREMASILNGNITDFCSVSAAGMVIKDLDALPREVTAAIQEIQETRNAQGTQIRIKLHDKIPVISAFIRMKGMNPAEKVDVTLHTLEDRLNEALKRVPIEIEGELVNE